tara:strand:+ start:21137 stop:21376 length:240 start_codon:yes stop_codon:yes gene_type:complete
MFEQLISLKSPLTKRGIVEFVKGNHYLAHQLDNEGNILKQAPVSFKSLAHATQWLKRQGIYTISLRQSPAYIEMIGLDA